MKASQLNTLVDLVAPFPIIVMPEPALCPKMLRVVGFNVIKSFVFQHSLGNPFQQSTFAAETRANLLFTMFAKIDDIARTSCPR